MKNIAVAIEFDEEVDDIVAFTSGLVKDKSTDVHVVHVYQPLSALDDYGPQAIKPVQDYEASLQRQADSIRAIVKTLVNAGVKAHGYMKPFNKNVPDSIIEFAKEKDAELIVIGTHHPKRLERMILGSVAEKVIRHSDTPVAVVPRK